MVVLTLTLDLLRYFRNKLKVEIARVNAHFLQSSTLRRIAFRCKFLIDGRKELFKEANFDIISFLQW